MRIAWNIRNIYLYLVAFVTLIMIIVGTAKLIDGIVGIVYLPPNSPAPIISKPPDSTNITDAEWEARQIKDQEANIQRERYNGIRNSLTSGALILVALPVYFYHWRKIQKEAEA
ncbi:MAG: hypothetical protein ACYCX4_07605 [Bacillota bacterium]